MSLFDTMRERNLLFQITSETKILAAQKANAGVYVGIDPSADSLHVGNLLQLIALKHLSDAGFKPMIIIGGATGLIGDPSGKLNERPLLPITAVKHNLAMIKQQLKTIIPEAIIYNNADWLDKISLIEYLRDFGKHFSINYMRTKEVISARLAQGISYTEFSYMLLQAIDFHHLYTTANCWLQIGGSDQWGNITAGLELISRLLAPQESKACGWTLELLTKPDGTKFGKSAEGTVWLSAEKTSPYALYQFFWNQPDDLVEKLLRMFTFIPIDQIKALMIQHQKAPFKREAQIALARAVVGLIHGSAAVNQSERIQAALYGTDPLAFTDTEWSMLAKTFPVVKLTVANPSLIDVLVTANLAQSKREAREFIQAGAVSINNKKISDLELKIKNHDTYLLLKRGKRKFALIQL